MLRLWQGLPRNPLSKHQWPPAHGPSPRVRLPSNSCTSSSTPLWSASNSRIWGSSEKRTRFLPRLACDIADPPAHSLQQSPGTCRPGPGLSMQHKVQTGGMGSGWDGPEEQRAGKIHGLPGIPVGEMCAQDHQVSATSSTFSLQHPHPPRQLAILAIMTRPMEHMKRPEPSSKVWSRRFYDLFGVLVGAASCCWCRAARLPTPRPRWPPSKGDGRAQGPQCFDALVSIRKMHQSSFGE